MKRRGLATALVLAGVLAAGALSCGDKRAPAAPVAASEPSYPSSLDPKAPLPRKNRAMVLLMCGRFAEGWPEFEFRFAADNTPPRPFAGVVA